MASRKRKSARPLRLLLDADVVIEAHRLGVWEELVARSAVACPGAVVHDEALFYCTDEYSVPTSIHLPSLVAAGRIAMLEATADDLRELAAILTPDALEGLHPGESEALALLLVGKARDHRFSSGDRAAIRALALLGLSERGISFECALDAAGLKKPLPNRLTEPFFQGALREGQGHRLRGLGLRRPASG